MLNIKQTNKFRRVQTETLTLLRYLYWFKNFLVGLSIRLSAVEEVKTITKSTEEQIFSLYNDVLMRAENQASSWFGNGTNVY